MIRTSKCPVCGSRDFFVKDPADEFETYVFQCQDGQIVYDQQGESPPEIEDDTQTFCERCAWHGEFCKLEE